DDGGWKGTPIGVATAERDRSQQGQVRVIMASESSHLSNAQIADRLAGLAQLLFTQKENPYKVKAYQRAAAKIRTLSESVEELVQQDSDLTIYAGIGEAISHAVQEIVRTGTLGKLETLRSMASPELAGLSNYPRLDPK